MDKLISIIIPCYNQGMYIDEAIKSVLSSTYTNLEIIVVNDGSTDNYTNEILLNKKWDKTIIYNIQNIGASKARNFAISKSSGEYILPLDADDKISNEFISDAVNILKSNLNIKIVCCEVELFGAKKGKYILPTPTIETLLGQNAMVVSSMFRRSDFDETSGFNANMIYGFEDWDFWLSLLENGGEVHKLDTVGFYYRIQKKSRNSSISKEQFVKLRRLIYDNHKKLYSKHFFDPTVSFEYSLVANSKEYKIGIVLLKPIRYIFNKLNF